MPHGAGVDLSHGHHRFCCRRHLRLQRVPIQRQHHAGLLHREGAQHAAAAGRCGVGFKVRRGEQLGGIWEGWGRGGGIVRGAESHRREHRGVGMEMGMKLGWKWDWMGMGMTW